MGTVVGNLIGANKFASDIFALFLTLEFDFTILRKNKVHKEVEYHQLVDKGTAMLETVKL